MATKQELENRVAELETINDKLLLDLEWERLTGQKILAAMALTGKKNKKERSGPQPAKKQGKAKGEGTTQVREKVGRDAFGQRLDTLGHKMNAPIIALIERGQFDRIKPETLSQMIGGQVSPGRFRDHLAWLKRRNLL